MAKPLAREDPVPTNLTREQEAQAQQLAAQLKEPAGDHFLAIARTLVATEERTLFGQTEFAIRDQILQLLGTAYSLHLGQKNGYRGASIDCPSAARRPRSTATGRENRKASEV